MGEKKYCWGGLASRHADDFLKHYSFVSKVYMGGNGSFTVWLVVGTHLKNFPVSKEGSPSASVFSEKGTGGPQE